MSAAHSTVSTVQIAIDTSKHRHELLIGISGKKRRRSVTITNSLEDFQRLVTAVASDDLPERINAMTILAEAGNLRRFRHHRQFKKFRGMNLVTIKSGMFRAQTRANANDITAADT